MTITLLVLALAAIVVVAGTWATAVAMIRSDVFSDGRQRISLTHATGDRHVTGDLAASDAR